MSRDSFLAYARSRTEAQFSDACTSRRKGDPTYDDATGNTTPAWTAVYSGPCELKQPRAAAISAQVGEAAVLLQQPTLKLPMSAPLHRPGDEITLTASTNDPASVGRVFTVRAVPADSGTTARRYEVTERTS